MLLLAACVCPIVILCCGYIVDAAFGFKGALLWVFALLALFCSLLFINADFRLWLKADAAVKEKLRSAITVRSKFFNAKAELEQAQKELDTAKEISSNLERNLYEATHTNQPSQGIPQPVPYVEEQAASVEFCGISYENYRAAIAKWVYDAGASIMELQQAVDSAEDKPFVRNLDMISSSIDNIICLSNLDQIEVSLQLTECHLGALIKECLKKHTVLLNEKKIGTLRKGLELIALTDSIWLSFAISQILLNAIAYTDEYGKIAISGRDAEDGIYILIEDSSPGCLPEELPYLFEAGYIPEEYRSYPDYSAGMCLFLAKNAIDRIGGRIMAESKPSKGMRIHLMLPKKY
jgi:signal transduction histidine kinase